MKPSVIVLGGGLSGLSAAAQLAHDGLDVTLIERSNLLGGRLASLVDPRSGRPVERVPGFTIDAGPCLGIALRRVGASSWFERERLTALPIAGSPPGQLGPSVLPGLFKFLPSIWSDPGLGWLDRILAVRVLAALRRARPLPPDTLTLYRHLRNLGQGNRVIGRVWNPLCMLATGLPVEEASAHGGWTTLRAMFDRGGGAPGLTLLRGGLTDDLGVRFGGFVKARGGRIVAGREAGRMIVVDGEIRGVQIGGEIARADGYVAAVPPDALLSLLGERWADHPHFKAARLLRWTPSVSVHLTMDRTPMSSSVAVSAEGEGFWFVWRPDSHTGRASGGVLSVYVPNGDRYSGASRDEIIEKVRRAVHELLPGSGGALVSRVLVVNHPRAAVSLRPGSLGARLPTGTPICNLWLAGSWTDTDLGSSLESSVKSGHGAASLASSWLGRPSLRRERAGASGARSALGTAGAQGLPATPGPIGV